MILLATFSLAALLLDGKRRGLSAAAQTREPENVSVRLEQPTFGLPQPTNRSGVGGQPQDNIRIIPRQTTAAPNGPVIQSRQQTLASRERPVYAAPRHQSGTPESFISHTQTLTRQPEAQPSRTIQRTTQPVSQESPREPLRPQRASIEVPRPEPAATSDAWSEPPPTSESNPQETERTLRNNRDGSWSHLPADVRTAQPMPGDTFSMLPEQKPVEPPVPDSQQVLSDHAQGYNAVSIPRDTIGRPVYIPPPPRSISAPAPQQAVVQSEPSKGLLPHLNIPQNRQHAPAPRYDLQTVHTPAITAPPFTAPPFTAPAVTAPAVTAPAVNMEASIPQANASGPAAALPTQTPGKPQWELYQPQQNQVVTRPMVQQPGPASPSPAGAAGSTRFETLFQTSPAEPQSNGPPHSAVPVPQSGHPAMPLPQSGRPAVPVPQNVRPAMPLPQSVRPAVPQAEIPVQPSVPNGFGHQMDITGAPDASLPSGHQPNYGSTIVPGPSMPATSQPVYQTQPLHSGSAQHGGHSLFGVRPGTSGFRATIEHDAQPWMSPYHTRAGMTDGHNLSEPLSPALPAIPQGYVPWWDAIVRQSSGVSRNSMPVDVSQLLRDAMLYSPQVTAIKAEPEVQYRVITQEAAEFDWTVFLDATYDDLNDPVGNELTTGNGDDRLITRKVRSNAGIRKRNLHGGELALSQRLGHENQNSRFFVPNNQASTRLELTYRQPLLDGAGRSYNESEIILARIRANSSEDEVVEALQDHLIEVTKAYWTLYRARAEFFQRRKLLTSAQTVLTRLQGRSQVDTIPRQVLRATAAVARAKTRIQRTIARVRDAEAQLRLLVNSPGMLNGGPTELTPIETPRMFTESADLQSVLQTALVNRPDISEAIRKMRASSVRLGVSKKELLPRLDFLVETYVADLSGNSNLRRALRGQFYDNRPGYTVGLEFEYPLENRAARAKLEQRQWELKRSINVFRATVEKSLTDVEIANREVATAYSEMLSRFQSMRAAENETAYLQDRFDVLPASEDSAILLLEDLLDSYERVADEESSFVQALVDHAVALIILKKELGILLQSRHSRPQVEPLQQQWLEGRIMSAVDSSSSAAATAQSPAGWENRQFRNSSTAEHIRPVSRTSYEHPQLRGVRKQAGGGYSFQ